MTVPMRTTWAAVLALLAVSCAGREATPNKASTRGSEFFDTASLQRYVGRTVGELVADLPEPYREVGPLDEPPGKLIGFALRFPDNRRIEVYCSNLEHVERFSEQRSWDFEAFKKEKISKVVARP
jgi:hypothetical protein